MLWFLYIVFARHRQDVIIFPYWKQCIYLITDRRESAMPTYTKGKIYKLDCAAPEAESLSNCGQCLGYKCSSIYYNYRISLS